MNEIMEEQVFPNCTVIVHTDKVTGEQLITWFSNDATQTFNDFEILGDEDDDDNNYDYEYCDSN